MSSLTIVTHNGAFHADEIFAVATVMLAFADKKIFVIRTRDENVINDADLVVDVGGIYNRELKRFDHHQTDGAGKRQNGVSYASFGLVWKEYGNSISGGEKVAEKIDNKLVAPVDAVDNGIAILNPIFDGIYPYTISDFFASFLPGVDGLSSDNDKAFMLAVSVAKDLLIRIINNFKEVVALEEKVKILYENSQRKDILILDNRYPWKDVAILYPELLYVVYPDNNNQTWVTKAVNVNGTSFDLRRPFPESWAGKIGRELIKETGVPDAIFCHNKRFIAVAKSREGAIALSEKSKESNK